MISSWRQSLLRPIPRSSLVVVALLGFIAVSLAGCARSVAGSGGTDISLQVIGEKVVGPATVEVTLRTADGDPIDTAEVVVRGEMNHAGMKPVIAQTKKVASGKYLSENFRFTMAGDWLITADITLSRGDKVERTIEVKGITGT